MPCAIPVWLFGFIGIPKAAENVHIGYAKVVDMFLTEEVLLTCFI